MSVLVHLCRDCAHQVSWHDPRNAGYTACTCCRTGTADASPEPVLQETYALPGWHPEPPCPPGTTRNPGSMHATTCCDCTACHAAYERLVGLRRTS